MSANTDGIVVWSPSREAHKALLEVAKAWSSKTRMILEENQYQSVHSQDVNNYLALTTNGEFKGKGVFAKAGLMKNPKNRILSEAIKRFIKYRTPIETTIRNSDNIADFMSIQKVSGGARWLGEPVGGVVRWYQSTEGSPITSMKTGNRIPLSDYAMLANNMPKTFPDDIDYDYYINAAKELAVRAGIHSDNL